MIVSLCKDYSNIRTQDYILLATSSNKFSSDRALISCEKIYSILSKGLNSWKLFGNVGLDLFPEALNFLSGLSW